MNGSRKFLVSSLIMIISCCLLFTATTFAWFSDSVSSNNNIITAGTLDIGLEYKTDVNNDWAPVEESTEVLASSDLWEPGFTKIVYFKISNEGSLSLKYSFNLNILLENESVNVNGKSFKLSDYLVYGVGETELAGRSEYVAAATNSFKSSNLLAQDVLEAKGVDYLWLVITMPTTVDNSVNTKPGHEAPRLQLGFDLLASQYYLESDSFGNDFDQNPTNGEAAVPQATVIKATNEVVLTANNTLYVSGFDEYLLDLSSMGDVQLETQYGFYVTNPADVINSEYATWHADFVISFDADVPAGAAAIAGQYNNEWTGDSWIAISNKNFDIPANEEIRLLAATLGVTINYEELAEITEGFHCGAFDFNNALAGVTMKVQLVIYETEKQADSSNNSANNEVVDGKVIVLREFTHTFTA